VDPGGVLRHALIHGDPLKPGEPFAFRYRCSSGYKVARHWHPVDENIAVLQGTFMSVRATNSIRHTCRTFPQVAMGSCQAT
jgi:hypothetical protein